MLVAEFFIFEYSKFPSFFLLGLDSNSTVHSAHFCTYRRAGQRTTCNLVTVPSICSVSWKHTKTALALFSSVRETPFVSWLQLVLNLKSRFGESCTDLVSESLVLEGEPLLRVMLHPVYSHLHKHIKCN